jgi:hypothetical protein
LTRKRKATKKVAPKNWPSQVTGFQQFMAGQGVLLTHNAANLMLALQIGARGQYADTGDLRSSLAVGVDMETVEYLGLDQESFIEAIVNLKHEKLVIAVAQEDDSPFLFLLENNPANIGAGRLSVN